jgi:phage terminase large subunit-like protein
MAEAVPAASVRELFANLPADVRAAVKARHGEDLLMAALAGSGSLRAAQLPPPGDWRIWVVLAGRGFGKTHAGALWVHQQATAAPRRIALVGATVDAARAVMVEGESGLLARVPPGERIDWVPSRKRLTWGNGSEARLYSGGDPDSLRGGQFHIGWGDEFAHWPRAEAALTNLRMATRLGGLPRLLLTTTPLPLDWLRQLIAEPDVVNSGGRTAENIENLPNGFVEGLMRRFGGTVTGRQELDGEIVNDLEGALWTRARIDRVRVQQPPHLVRVVVAVDPPAGGGTCGILVVALGADGHGYVLDDASVAAARPEAWARAVVMAADRWQADRVVAEVNNGGDMVVAVLKAVDAALPVQAVRASRGKAARAEPVAGLYAEGRVYHAGVFPALEDQMCGLLLNGIYAGPGPSPDRADALVWGLTALLLAHRISEPGVRRI